MRILFVHHYFPGQFQRIARHYLASGEHDIVGLYRGLQDGRSMPLIDGIRTLEYGQEVRADRDPDHVLHDTEQYIREAVSVALCANGLKEEGWEPDLVYSHSGWGTGAFLQDVFPRAKFIKYCEWFYNNASEDGAFLNPRGGVESRVLRSLLNIPILADLVRADLLIAPTDWQKSQFPVHMRDAIQVVPDGVDTDLFKPDPNATFKVNDRTFRPGDRVITYVARGADPYRGFRPFMEALAIVQSRDPSVDAIIVGDRKIYYASGNGSEDHFGEVMEQVPIDPARTHFTGVLAYDDYRNVLQISAVHVYLTVPFVLSWSALEALSTGCIMVGSKTAPVMEFVENGKNGLLADFSDPADIADRIMVALAGGSDIERMRQGARQTILNRWSADSAISLHQSLVSEVIARSHQRATGSDKVPASMSGPV